MELLFARWRKVSLIRETSGNISEVPRKKAEFDDKVVRMNKFDKKSSQLEKNLYFCSPK